MRRLLEFYLALAVLIQVCAYAQESSPKAEKAHLADEVKTSKDPVAVAARYARNLETGEFEFGLALDVLDQHWKDPRVAVVLSEIAKEGDGQEDSGELPQRWDKAASRLRSVRAKARAFAIHGHFEKPEEKARAIREFLKINISLLATTAQKRAAVEDGCLARELGAELERVGGGEDTAVLVELGVISNQFIARYPGDVLDYAKETGFREVVYKKNARLRDGLPNAGKRAKKLLLEWIDELNEENDFFMVVSMLACTEDSRLDMEELLKSKKWAAVSVAAVYLVNKYPDSRTEELLARATDKADTQDAKSFLNGLISQLPRKR